MLSRRTFLLSSAAAAVTLRGATMTSTDRVDRALKGLDVDRSPFSYWYHFLDASKPGQEHARSTLAFHDKFHTDLVKVMSDYPYPKARGEWWALREEENPFPRQIVALEKIRDGLGGKAYFVETMFNPFKVAENLSSPEEVKRLQHEKPQALLDAMEVIAKSEANHARRAIAAGASGVFVAIANAQTGYMTPADYAKFSEPFDKMVLEAVRSAPLNVLHLHGDKVYLDRFYRGWQATGINYSAHGTGVSIAKVRAQYSGVILGGLDEVNFRKLTAADLKRQWIDARNAAGANFILTPGCSVPNETTDDEMRVLSTMLGAG
jgi:uroporphyrinogen decarboxylase